MTVKIMAFVAAFLIPVSGMTQAPAVPAPPSGSASSYILMDYNSGRILAEHNSAEPVEPASLTKMMTVYIAGEELQAGHISLNDEVLVSEKAWKTGGSKMFIEVNARVSVEELLNGIIIQSGNDSSVALAEHISGSEDVFAQLMNQAAAKLNMKNTHFENSTGMPADGHITTAYDMAILSAALIRNHPELYGMHAIKEYTYNDITQPNRNQLLWRDESVDGIKTGHTENAGYCLVASAERGDMRLISVVMGTESIQARTSFSQALLEYGYRFFETREIADSSKALGTTKVWKGASDEVNYGVAKDVHVTLPRGEVDNIQINNEINQPLVAPLRNKQAIGKLTVSLDDEILVEKPLVAITPVEQGGIVKRLIDSAWLLFE